MTILDQVKQFSESSDVISHFGVASDLIRHIIVKPGAFENWTGRIIVLSAENDPTWQERFSRYEKLFGRPVEVISLGDMGHTAALFDPDQYVEMLESALE